MPTTVASSFAFILHARRQWWTGSRGRKQLPPERLQRRIVWGRSTRSWICQQSTVAKSRQYLSRIHACVGLVPYVGARYCWRISRWTETGWIQPMEHNTASKHEENNCGFTKSALGVVIDGNRATNWRCTTLLTEGKLRVPELSCCTILILWL